MSEVVSVVVGSAGPRGPQGVLMLTTVLDGGPTANSTPALIIDGGPSA